MSGSELRQSFLDFFASGERDHLVLPSAPLVPQRDPTLLWNSAGMAPLKAYFDGRETPPRDRIATCQKCIRTNDIENVGKTARHHTFFEMLGNFSFGDYFKREAIAWAYQYVTEELAMEEERIWASVYHEDQEAFDLWKEEIGLPPEKIVHLGKKDNFWEIGTGPCGPCSELYYDRGPDFGCGSEDCRPGCDCDRYLEIWNLVFTQFDKTEEGEYLTLPQKNIDTGLGLERVASILQDVNSNYDTDLVRPLIDYTSSLCGIKYGQDKAFDQAFQVIADHLRGVSFALADGVLPSNEGRGYIIRRLLRRAIRYGQRLELDPLFLYGAHQVVMEIFGEDYPELVDKRDHISRVIRGEEERFQETLDQGLNLLYSLIGDLKDSGEKKIAGRDAFKLYDTYGFPLELTSEIAAEEGLEIEIEAFEEEMEKQKQRARQAAESGGDDFGTGELFKELRQQHGETQFTGYSQLEQRENVLALIKENKEVESLSAGEEGEVVFSRTPFYAEGGGQQGDQGLLTGEGVKARVKDTRQTAGITRHLVEVEKGQLKPLQSILLRVDSQLRQNTARHHTATHLLHQALREVLGNHVQQTGSLVAPERLRFDFSHFEALAPAEIRRLEQRVNQMIIDNTPVEEIEMSFEEAREEGALALFEDKYDERVRVIKSSPESQELCGGTHVSRTGDLGLFRIESEASAAAGIRRIEALCGPSALNYVEEREDILLGASELLGASPEEIIARLEKLLEEHKRLQSKNKELLHRIGLKKSERLLDKREDVNGITLLVAEVEDMDTDNLRRMTDKLRAELGSGIILLGTRNEERVLFVAAVTEDLVKKGYHAGQLIGSVARVAGGGGGGRPQLAEAGGSKPERLEEAFQEARKILQKDD